MSATPVGARMRRLVRFVVPVTVAAGLLTGCGERESRIDEVRAAIAATRREAGNFVYLDSRAGTDVTVAGALEDDFRFKALVSYDGRPGYEEIVNDDALALRFHNAERLPTLVDPQRLDSADLTTELEGVTPLQALQSRRWVVDVDGAPPVTSLGFLAEDVGDDPVFDAITALDYVDQAMGEAFEVEKWSPDALNPTYSSSEDFFPKPEDGSGVTRYDLNRPFLPPAGAGGGTGDRALPTTKNFRKMAIYVEDGRVIRVLERIEVVGKFVSTLEEYLQVFVREAQLPERFVERFELIRGARVDEAERGSLYLEFLNVILVGLGEDPILVRNMSLEVSQGEGVVSIELPTDDIVIGSLEVMLASRQSKAAAEETGGDEEEPAPGEPTLPTETTVPADGATTSSVPGGEEPAPPPEEPVPVEPEPPPPG